MLNLSVFIIIASFIFFALVFYGAALSLFVYAARRAAKKQSAAIFVILGAVFIALAVAFTVIVILSFKTPIPAPKTDYPSYVV